MKLCFLDRRAGARRAVDPGHADSPGHLATPPDRFGPRRVVICGAAYLALYLLWHLDSPDARSHAALIADLFPVPVDVAAIALCWRAARRCRGDRLRLRAWRLVSVAMVGYLFGELLQCYQQGVLHHRDSPDASDLIFYLFFFAGLIAFANVRANSTRRFMFSLDLAVVGLGGGALLWYFVAGPSITSDGHPLHQVVYALAYPVGDLLLLLAAVRALGRGVPPNTERAVRALTAGIFLYVGGDTVVGYDSLHSSDIAGTAAQVLLLSASLCYVLAGSLQSDRARASRSSRVDAWATWLLPNAAAAGGFALLFVVERHERFFPLVSVSLIVTALAALVVLRQVLGQRALGDEQVKNDDLSGELRHRAFHDPLTGLPNRALLGERLANVLTRDRSCASGHGLLVLEIDGLTSVNDSYGHQLGEELLRVLADRICSAVRGGDTVARLGSDEFAVLLEDLPDDKTASVIAAQIQAQLASPIRLGGHTVQVQSSVGIAFAGEDDVGAEELLRCAAAASYEARYQRDGKSRCCVFSPAMGAALADRLQLGEELRGAMERGELRVYYQPIVELATGRLSGCEALVRWMHPTRGLLAPGVFLPIAEQLGLLHEIDSWTLRVACNEAAGWVREFPGRGELSIDVNVSPSQLREDTFVGLVAGAISRSGLEPHRLVLELVESSVVDDLELARARLAELKALGVRLAVDDFGTGYSSLSHLRVLPIDVIKIDRSFVAAMEQSAQAGALVSSLIQLASALGIDTVAEGIEDHFQLARLKSENCRYGQGYLFARPLDQEAFRALLGSKGSSGVTGRSAVTVS